MQLERRYRVRHETLPISAITAHPQMRITMDGEKIEQLAENIRVHGLIHPICVAEIDNEYIVVSGHRRLRACQLLEDRGHDCEELPVVIFEGLTQVEMALLQASENIHEQVPPHEAAQFYEATWRLLKLHQPDFTLIDFAHAVGRSEKTIRNALRFALLPDKVRQFVSGDFLQYGCAVHLSRLYEYLSEDVLEQWALRFITSNTKVSSAKDQVNKFISYARSGQISMLDVFEESVRKVMEKESRHMLIDRETVWAFWAGIAYLKKLLSLFEQRKIDANDSPWIRRGPKRAFLELVTLERDILEHLQYILSPEESGAARCVIEECEVVCDVV